MLRSPCQPFLHLCLLYTTQALCPWEEAIARSPSRARGAAMADSGDTHAMGSGSAGPGLHGSCDGTMGARERWPHQPGLSASRGPQHHHTHLEQFKNQGLFDSFARTAWPRWTSSQLTKPEAEWIILLSTHLDKWEWNPSMNKNQLVNGSRQSVVQSGMLEAGVDRILLRWWIPKLTHIFWHKQNEQLMNSWWPRKAVVPALPPPRPISPWAWKLGPSSSIPGFLIMSHTFWKLLWINGEKLDSVTSFNLEWRHAKVLTDPAFNADCGVFRQEREQAGL